MKISDLIKKAKQLLPVILLCFILSPSSVFAQVVITSGAHFINKNLVILKDIDLKNNGTYNATAGNTIFNGSATSSITGNGTTVFKNLSVNKSPTTELQLDNNITVNGVLSLKANLNLKAKNINLGGNGLLVESPGMLLGSSGTIFTKRELSNLNAQNVGGLGATISTTTNLGSTTITRGHAIQNGTFGESIKRYYDISPTVNTDLNATLVFNYLESEVSGSENLLKLYRSTNNGASWTYQGGTINTTANQITLANIPSFSRWTASGNTFSLSLNVNPSNAATVSGAGSYSIGQSVSVSTTGNPGYTFVNWTTVDMKSKTEDKNKTISRLESKSINKSVVSTEPSFSFSMPSLSVLLTANYTANNYNLILVTNPVNSGVLTGAGTFTIGQAFTAKAVANPNFSFVNWIDQSTGEIVSTELEYASTMPPSDLTLIANFSVISAIEQDKLPTETTLSQNYPNPFNPETTIKFALAKDSPVNLTVYNHRGEIVKMISKSNCKAGYHFENFNATGLNSGVYIYKLTTLDQSFVKKMLLVK